MRRFHALTLSLLLLAPLAGRAETLVGVGGAGGLVGAHVEFTSTRGSIWVLLGSYASDTGFALEEDLTAIVGLRRFQGGLHDKSTYFGGAFIGDVDGGESGSRYGAGGEIGYQWITTNLRLSLQAGMALVEGDDDNPGESAIRPVPVLGATAAMRF